MSNCYGITRGLRRHRGTIRVRKLTAKEHDRQLARERTFWQRQLASCSAVSPALSLLLEAAAAEEASPRQSLSPNDCPF